VFEDCRESMAFEEDEWIEEEPVAGWPDWWFWYEFRA